MLYEVITKPAIYGNRIVWSADDNVYLWDISTSTQTKIGKGSNPDIYDAKVVYYSYSEDPEADITIRMYDIDTKEKITVASYGDPNIPRIWGTKVIWSDRITSYNVCYTKLLRWIKAIEATRFWLSLKDSSIFTSLNFSASRLRRDEITCRLFLIL